MSELNYDAIEYLRNFLPDSSFFDELLPLYDELFETIGERLLKKTKELWTNANLDPYFEELVDYLDGNGFIVTRGDPKGIRLFDRLTLLEPIYPAERILKPVPVPMADVDLSSYSIEVYVPYEEEPTQETTTVYYYIEPKITYKSSIYSYTKEAARPPPFFYLTFCSIYTIINIAKERNNENEKAFFTTSV